MKNLLVKNEKDFNAQVNLMRILLSGNNQKSIKVIAKIPLKANNNNYVTFNKIGRFI